MEHLWAPWRMQFIEELRESGSGCLFCDLNAPGNDRQRLILYRGTQSYVVLNRYPYTNGHLMVVPIKHAGDLTTLSSEEQGELMRLASSSIGIMREALHAEGFNCGINIGQAAGAGIKDHVHVHVVPRWSGDANFLPIIGGARSMPEYLDETYERLIGGFGKLKKG